MSDSKSQSDENTSFPYRKMIVLLTVALSSSLCLTGLFPYVAFMVVDLHAASNVDSAGYMSGYISSAFLFGRMLTSFFWGRVADTYGRLPVLYFGCTTIVIMSIVFGLSVNIWMAIISRFLLGLGNPLAGLVKTLVSEVCGPTHEKAGMALTTGAWSLGLVAGPAVGGLLSRPAAQYPDTFGESSFLKTFPYILPNLFTAAVALLGMVLIYFNLSETLHKKASDVNITNESVECDEVEENGTSYNPIGDKCAPNDDEEGQSDGIECVDMRKNNTGDVQGVRDADIKSNYYQNIDDEHTDRNISKPRCCGSIRDLLSTQSVSVLVIAYFSVSLSAIVYDEVMPLWALSSVRRGGLGYESRDVGQVMSIVGIPVVVFTFVGYPYLAKQLGEVKCFQVGQMLGGVLCFCTVLLRLLPLTCEEKDGMDSASDSCRNKWIMEALLVFMSSLCHMSYVLAFTSLFLLINRSVPTDQRASVNGLAMTVGSVSKAIGPIAGSILYAWSIHNGLRDVPPLNYMFVFALCLLLSLVTFLLPIGSPVSKSNCPLETGSASDTNSTDEYLEQTVESTSRSTHWRLFGQNANVSLFRYMFGDDYRSRNEHKDRDTDKLLTTRNRCDTSNTP